MDFRAHNPVNGFFYSRMKQMQKQLYMVLLAAAIIVPSVGCQLDRGGNWYNPLDYSVNNPLNSIGNSTMPEPVPPSRDSSPEISIPQNTSSSDSRGGYDKGYSSMGYDRGGSSVAQAMDSTPGYMTGQSANALSSVPQRGMYDAGSAGTAAGDYRTASAGGYSSSQPNNYYGDSYDQAASYSGAASQTQPASYSGYSAGGESYAQQPSGASQYGTDSYYQNQSGAAYDYSAGDPTANRSADSPYAGSSYNTAGAGSGYPSTAGAVGGSGYDGSYQQQARTADSYGSPYSAGGQGAVCTEQGCTIGSAGGYPSGDNYAPGSTYYNNGTYNY